MGLHEKQKMKQRGRRYRKKTSLSIGGDSNSPYATFRAETNRRFSSRVAMKSREDSACGRANKGIDVGAKESVMTSLRVSPTRDDRDRRFSSEDSPLSQFRARRRGGQVNGGVGRGPTGRPAWTACYRGLCRIVGKWHQCHEKGGVGKVPNPDSDQKRKRNSHATIRKAQNSSAWSSKYDGWALHN